MSMLYTNNRPCSLWPAGVTGLVQIDDKGDRETDFAFWDMTDTNTSIFEVGVGLYTHKYTYRHTHTPKGVIGPAVLWVGL